MGSGHAMTRVESHDLQPSQVYAHSHSNPPTLPQVRIGRRTRGSSRCPTLRSDRTSVQNSWALPLAPWLEHPLVVEMEHHSEHWPRSGQR